jgi:hypothetical protein
MNHNPRPLLGKFVQQAKDFFFSDTGNVEPFMG